MGEIKKREEQVEGKKDGRGFVGNSCGDGCCNAAFGGDWRRGLEKRIDQRRCRGSVAGNGCGGGSYCAYSDGGGAAAGGGGGGGLISWKWRRKGGGSFNVCVEIKEEAGGGEERRRGGGRQGGGRRE